MYHVYSDDSSMIQEHTSDPANFPDQDQKSSTIRRRTVFRQFFAAAGLAVSGVALTSFSDKEAAANHRGPRSIRDQVRSVQRHENAHVAFLVTALGSSARPKLTFKNLRASNQHNFLTLGWTFENVGVGAYLGAAPAILSPSQSRRSSSFRNSNCLHFLSLRR